MKPLVTIVIPHTWDRPLRCMDSIKAQTYNELEIIRLHGAEKLDWLEKDMYQDLIKRSV